MKPNKAVSAHYPFGLQIANNALAHENRLKYNGKELQEFSLNGHSLDWYDYGARFYDPTLGRWHSVDPLVEMSRRWSPYHYGYNNPTRFTDPDGMHPDDYLPIDGYKPKDKQYDFEEEDIFKKPRKDKDNDRFKVRNWYDDSMDRDEEKDRKGYDWNRTGYHSDSKSSGDKSKKAGGETEEKKPESSGGNLFWRTYADFLYNYSTHFRGAVAIFFDAGFSLVNAEGDTGYFFILTGSEKGTFVPYREWAEWGLAAEVSGSGEIGRIDYAGNPNEFQSYMLFGDRTKGWVGGNAVLLTGSVAVAISNDLKVIATSLQLGVGVSYPVYGGFNHGYVRPPK